MILFLSKGIDNPGKTEQRELHEHWNPQLQRKKRYIHEQSGELT